MKMAWLLYTTWACRQPVHPSETIPEAPPDTATDSPGDSCEKEEIPYDGVDQDCDGQDLTDVDGDGVVAVEAGGTDCNDRDAQAFPGAAEVAETGGDEDCDGRVDERTVCATGNADFSTVQAAVDGTPDGGTLELCPGVYAEEVHLVNRVLRLEGAGVEPADVLFDRSQGAGVVVDGPLSDVTVRWIGLIGSQGAYDGALMGTDPGTLRVSQVDFCGKQPGEATWMVWSGESEISDITIEYSSFCPQGNETGVRIEFPGSTNTQMKFQGNVVDGNFWLWATSIEPGKTEIKNNIFTNGNIYFVNNINHRNEEVMYNTFMNSMFKVDIFQYSEIDPPEIYLTKNIFYWSLPSEWLWYVYLDAPMEDGQYLDATDIDPYTFAPTSFRENVMWPFLPTELFRMEVNITLPHPEHYVFTAPGEAMAAQVALCDPQFTTDPQKGSYEVGATSTCPADVGAFGGTGGDWYLHFPWPLP